MQGRAIARVVVRGRGRTERRIFVSPLVCLPPTNYPSRLTRCVVRAMIARLACCTPRLTQMCTLIRCRFVYCSMKLCVSCLYTCERCVYTRAKTCIHTEHDVIHTSKSVRVYTLCCRVYTDQKCVYTIPLSLVHQVSPKVYADEAWRIHR